MAKIRVEDEADKWLRDHDPYYVSTKRDKRKREKYPYDTPEQEHRRTQIEIPISNLSKRQKTEIKVVMGAYDGSGEFNL